MLDEVRDAERAAESFDRGLNPPGVARQLAAIVASGSRRDALGGIRVPTLVIHGDSDLIVPFEVSGKRSHEAIAGSQLALIEGAPHGLNVTHADQFNRALLDFLAG